MKQHNEENKQQQYKLAIVTATAEQLSEVGIDENIIGKTVKVFDIDRYNGYYPPCSRIVVDDKFEWLAKKGTNMDYIIPSRWLNYI